MRLPSGFMPHLCENTGIAPARNGISRVRSLKSKRMVSGSTTTAREIWPKYTAYCGAACGLFSVSNENLTSSAVTGSPFEKCALRVDVERGGQAVGRDADVVGEKTVRGRYLVETARCQALEHITEPGRRVAAQGERVEFVEAREPVRIRQNQRAAARRIRIDVVEVLEIGGIFRLAVLRDGVHGQCRFRYREPAEADQQAARTEDRGPVGSQSP